MEGFGETPVFAAPNNDEVDRIYEEIIAKGKTSILDYIEEVAARKPKDIALMDRVSEGVYKNVTYEEMLYQCKSLGKALIDGGMVPEIEIDGNKMRFLGAFLVNRYEAAIADLAALFVRAMTVTLFEEPVDHLEYLLNEGSFDTIIIQPLYAKSLLTKMEGKSLRIIKNFVLTEELDVDYKNKAESLGIHLLYSSGYSYL